VQSTAYTNKTVPMVRHRVVDSNLTIYNMTMNDVGTYKCTAMTHDRKTGSDSVHIQVYSKLFPLLSYSD